MTPAKTIPPEWVPVPAAKVGDGVLWKRGNSEVGVRCRHGARKGIDKWHHAITAEPVAGQVAEVGGLLKMELLATKVFAVEANAVTEFPFNRDARSRAADERPHCKKAKAFTVEVQAVVAVSGLAAATVTADTAIQHDGNMEDPNTQRGNRRI